MGRLAGKSAWFAKLFHVEQFRVNGTGLARHVVSSFVLLGMDLRRIMPKCASCSEWGFSGLSGKNRRGISMSERRVCVQSRHCVFANWLSRNQVQFR